MEGSEARISTSALEKRMPEPIGKIGTLQAGYSRQSRMHESAVHALFGYISPPEAEVSLLRTSPIITSGPPTHQLIVLPASGR
jgi:hypothetical protein